MYDMSPGRALIGDKSNRSYFRSMQSSGAHQGDWNCSWDLRKPQATQISGLRVEDTGRAQNNLAEQSYNIGGQLHAPAF
jgi:hypothetical protein